MPRVEATSEARSVIALNPRGGSFGVRAPGTGINLAVNYLFVPVLDPTCGVSRVHNQFRPANNGIVVVF